MPAGETPYKKFWKYNLIADSIVVLISLYAIIHYFINFKENVQSDDIPISYYLIVFSTVIILVQILLILFSILYFIVKKGLREIVIAFVYWLILLFILYLHTAAIGITLMGGM